MQEEMKSHISYKEYQKKINKKPNEGIAIFVSAFFILLLLFLGIAKQLSPEIDVSIGDDTTASETSEKVGIDERLKLLQMEDKDIFAPELDEKVVIPETKAKDHEEESEEPVALETASPKPEQTASEKPAQTVQNVQTVQPAQTAKVVVGYYSAKEQAEVAKGIIEESGLNISPFVRSIGGAYTIQVGSYSTREKAQSVVNDLLRNNYPARIIME